MTTKLREAAVNILRTEDRDNAVKESGAYAEYANDTGRL